MVYQNYGSSVRMYRYWSEEFVTATKFAALINTNIRRVFPANFATSVPQHAGNVVLLFVLTHSLPAI